MSFQEFTSAQVQHDLGPTLHDADLFAAASPAAVREEFAAFMRDGVSVAVANSTEKAKSEFIIAPVLLEFRRTSGQRIFLFSGVDWDADASRGLNGCERRKQIFAVASPARRVECAPMTAISTSHQRTPSSISAAKASRFRPAGGIYQPWGQVNVDPGGRPSTCKTRSRWTR